MKGGDLPAFPLLREHQGEAGGVLSLQRTGGEVQGGVHVRQRHLRAKQADGFQREMAGAAGVDCAEMA